MQEPLASCEAVAASIGAGDCGGAPVSGVPVSGAPVPELSVFEHRALREHLESCAACRDAYRTAVESAARVGRERRELRVAVERTERSDRLRRLALGAGAPARDLSRLRPLLYSALVIFLFVQLARPVATPDPAELTVLAGRARVGESHLDSAPQSRAVSAGTWCVTDARGRARLAVRGNLLVLEPDTRLLLEREEPLRLRVAGGEIALDGSARILTCVGVVELRRADARVRLTREALEVESRTGEVEATWADGSRRLRAGESLRLLRPVAPAPLATDG